MVNLKKYQFINYQSDNLPQFSYQNYECLADVFKNIIIYKNI